jgi:hypothetical protein
LPVRIGEAEFALIPFTGHTRGHCAVALRLDDRWLLHCGDAYGDYRQANPVQPYKHPNGRLMETIVTDRSPPQAMGLQPLWIRAYSPALAKDHPCGDCR